jgi:predicted PurR-regulated permease PerM
MVQNLSGRGLSDAERVFVRGVLLVLAIGGLAVLVWLLSELLLLVFASILLAVVLRSGGALLSAYTGAREAWSIALVGLVIAIIAALAIMLFRAKLRGQLEALGSQLTSVEHTVGRYVDVVWVKELAVVSVLLIAVGGVYIAVNPIRPSIVRDW